MRSQGATEAQIDAFFASRESAAEDFVLFPENVRAVDAFLQFSHLFRVENGYLTGLDPVSIEAECRLSGRRLKPRLYRAMQDVAHGYMQARNEQLEARLNTLAQQQENARP
jgi:hypothetical protein